MTFEHWRSLQLHVQIWQVVITISALCRASAFICDTNHKLLLSSSAVMQFFVKLLSNPNLGTKSFFSNAFINKHLKVIINSSKAVLFSRQYVVYVHVG